MTLNKRNLLAYMLVYTNLCAMANPILADEPARRDG
jgi:hypothetical protein